MGMWQWPLHKFLCPYECSKYMMQNYLPQDCILLGKRRHKVGFWLLQGFQRGRKEMTELNIDWLLWGKVVVETVYAHYLIAYRMQPNFLRVEEISVCYKNTFMVLLWQEILIHAPQAKAMPIYILLLRNADFCVINIYEINWQYESG